VITDLSVQYANGFGEIYPNPIPDLYAGQPTMILGKISDDVDEIILTGRRAGERWTQTISIPTNAESGATQASSLAMQWARAKVESLLDEQRNSVDNERHKETITALAIDVGLVTPYTSFVAFEAEPVRPTLVPGKSVKVASLVPHGNDMQILHLPQSAAGRDMLALLSLVFALCGCSLLYIGVRPASTGNSST
jgi:Ca-activated chloride channel family protein